MGKAARNRAIRKRAVMFYPDRARSVARALRRHGRLPLEPTGVSNIGGTRAPRFGRLKGTLILGKADRGRLEDQRARLASLKASQSARRAGQA